MDGPELKIQDHVRLHATSARYHTAVLYFHLRKMEDPMYVVHLPVISPHTDVSQEMVDYCNQNLHKLLL